jgi:hypothetical protein
MISELMPIGYDIVYGELRTMDASLSRSRGHLDGTERSSQRAVRFVSVVSTVVYANGADAVRQAVKSYRSCSTISSADGSVISNKRDGHLISAARSPQQTVHSPHHALQGGSSAGTGRLFARANRLGSPTRRPPRVEH